MKILRRLLWLFFLFTLITCAVALVYYHAVTKHVELSPDKLTLNERSVLVFDAQNTPVKNVTEFWKQTVLAPNIPTHTKQAFIDTEDKRFWTHNGFDYKRMARAVVNNLKARSFKEGASTISQQLIKNTHLSQEKTLKRKLQEWKLTRQLERRYSKDEILEKYLNTIYFGHSCFGLSAAAEFYFDKQVGELSLGDSAILAGLIKSPNHYSPFKHPESCQKRKAVVLNAMYSNGSISDTERRLALDEPLPTPTSSHENTGYLHFVFEEFTELADTLDLHVGGKLEIQTYLDQALQTEIETLASNVIDCDKTIIVADNETLGFKGAYSSAGNIPRLPGSLIKPLLVYTPALEENVLSPATPILDEKIQYGDYTPENFDKQYHGYVSTRECVAKSYNIPAVKTLSALGVKKGVEYLQKLGLNVEKEDHSLALALGGMQHGFSLCDITSAYTALANGGNYGSCGFISEIKVNGILAYKKKKTSTRVFSEESAYLMTDMLKTAVQSGTAKKMRNLPFEIAAKTGTVGTKNGNTDAYALSYTTRNCATVWLGNVDNTPIAHTGGGEPCNILNKLNSYIYEHDSKQSSILPFKRPNGVVCVALDKDLYYDTHTLSLADESAPATHQISEWFKKNAIPLNKSTFFSNPTIPAPTVELVNDMVLVHLNESSPRYYTYKIERSDYATHRTLYEGEYLPLFEDTSIEKEKQYVYTITPIYKERTGTPITLPPIFTGTGKSPSWEDNMMLDKNWWDD